MYVVILRATIGALDEEYAGAITRMKQLALEEYGCLEFVAMMDGDQRIALSYWTSEEEIQRWKQNSEHLQVQGKARKKWYESYSVQVTRVEREYAHK